MPWLRVYGPFKNSRLADWTIFYTSFIFIQLFEANNLIGWWEGFIKILFLKYTFITIGIILFYGVGEVWRKRLQFIRLTNFAKAIIAGTMTLGVALLIFQGLELYDPVHLNSYLIKAIALAFLYFRDTDSSNTFKIKI